MNHNLLKFRYLLPLALLSVAFLAGCGGGGKSDTPQPSRSWKGFLPKTSYPINGNSSAAIVAADLNADSKPDLLMTDARNGFLRILFNRGDGRFGETVARPQGFDPRRAVTADFDRDGKLDMALIGHFANGWTVRRGRGDGNFDDGSFYNLEAHGRYLLTADFDHDGILDIAALSGGSGVLMALHVYRGAGDGTFTKTWFYQTESPNASGFAAADVTADGIPDIVIAGQGDDETPVIFFSGKGNGTFSGPTALPGLAIPPRVTDGTNRLALADVTGDGKTDILTTHNINYEMVAVRPSRGEGQFGEATRLEIGVPEDVSVADLNRDGIPDIIATSGGSSTASYFLGRGGGAFSAPVVLPVGLGPSALAIADFNGDGWADMATVNLAEGTVSVLLNAGEE